MTSSERAIWPSISRLISGRVFEECSRAHLLILVNQVESWFSRLQRDVIDHGIFTSVADLKRKIFRYIKLY